MLIPRTIYAESRIYENPQTHFILKIYFLEALQ